jgi:hypothetical protein
MRRFPAAAQLRNNRLPRRRRTGDAHKIKSGVVDQAKVRTTDTDGQMLGQMPQITSVAVDPIRHAVYAAHLGGQVTVVDGRLIQQYPEFRARARAFLDAHPGTAKGEARACRVLRLS